MGVQHWATYANRPLVAGELSSLLPLGLLVLLIYYWQMVENGR